MKVRTWLAAALFAWAWGAQAAGEAVVDAVQAPAWVERGGQRRPLVPGMELQNHDRLVTGADARALVQLADGSAVRLGEDAQVAVNALGRRDGGVFTAALDVAAGAFRLTTDSLRKLRSRRAINVRVGQVTAGIRGTDLWGKSSNQRDVVCLLEGRIWVTHPLAEAIELSEPLQYYGAEKGKAPEPVEPVSPVQLQDWAAETELQDGVPTQRRGGRWAVGLATVDSQAAALDLHDRLEALGYGAKIRPVRNGAGGYRYEIRVAGLVNETDARRLGERLARKLELDAPQVVGR